MSRGCRLVAENLGELDEKGLLPAPQLGEVGAGRSGQLILDIGELFANAGGVLLERGQRGLLLFAGLLLTEGEVLLGESARDLSGLLSRRSHCGDRHNPGVGFLRGLHRAQELLCGHVQPELVNHPLSDRCRLQNQDLGGDLGRLHHEPVGG